MPEALLKENESGEHLLPHGCSQVPLETKGLQTLKPICGQEAAVPETPLIIYPIGKL